MMSAGRQARRRRVSEAAERLVRVREKEDRQEQENADETERDDANARIRKAPLTHREGIATWAWKNVVGGERLTRRDLGRTLFIAAYTTVTAWGVSEGASMATLASLMLCTFLLLARADEDKVQVALVTTVFATLDTPKIWLFAVVLYILFHSSPLVFKK